MFSSDLRGRPTEVNPMMFIAVMQAESEGNGNSVSKLSNYRREN